jgi:hypothetical protein
MEFVPAFFFVLFYLLLDSQFHLYIVMSKFDEDVVLEGGGMQDEQFQEHAGHLT